MKFLVTIFLICSFASSVSSLQRELYERANNQNFASVDQAPFGLVTSHQDAFESWPASAAHGAAQETLGGALVRQTQNQIRPAGNNQQPREPWRYQAATNLELKSNRALAKQQHDEQLEHPAKQAAARSHAAAPHQQAHFSQPSNLEQALRQTSGDESVLTPAPIPGAPGHSSRPTLDWLARGPDRLAASATSTAPKMPSHRDESAKARGLPSGVTDKVRATPMLPATTATSPTELSNSVAPSQMEPLVLSHQNSILGHVHQKEYETNANNSAAIELSNQVVYEGPATAPPSQREQHSQQQHHEQAHERPLSAHAVSASDFYFSATAMSGQDNNQNNELANSNAWWAIGAGDEFERASNLTRDNFLEYCEQTPLLVNNKQRSLCRMHHRVMPVVARGIRMAIDECQLRFAHSRWNCSLMLLAAQQQQQAASNAKQHTDLANSLTANVHGHHAPSAGQIFGDVMRHPNRERSFLNAILAAALAHSMTKACSQGELPEECSCDRRIKSKNNRGRIEWVACSDDIDYGARFSRDFTDNFDQNELDTTATIYMHNSEVGRRVFKSYTDIACTCLNGEIGQCQTKRCWKHLGSFGDVVDEIMRRYESATHVQRSNRDPHKLRPVRRGVRKPKRKDLVYIDESPDYCQRDLRIGVLGTQNRSCNSTSQGPDSCSLLCCGRGFQRVVEHIEEDCNCKFVWCCEVKCDKCSRYVTNDVCN